MKFKALVAGIAGVFSISTAALAADPVMIAPPPPPVMVAPAGYDWSGPYAGASAYIGAGIGVGGHVGFYRARGNVVLGAEALIVAPFGNPPIVAGVGKIGFAVGPTDRLLIYGTLGWGFSFGGGSGLVAAAGVGFGINDRMSGFLELGLTGIRGIRAGVNFHFGN